MTTKITPNLGEFAKSYDCIAYIGAIVLHIISTYPPHEQQQALDSLTAETFVTLHSINQHLTR